MATEPLALLLSLAVGVSLGLFFYGGLWWTVSKGISATGPAGKHPGLWFLGSQFLRTVTVISGIYFVSLGDLKRLLSCFAGFVVGRVVVAQVFF